MGHFYLHIQNIRKITNLFKQTDIKIAFRCKNTLTHLVKTTHSIRPPPHDRPGIYQLKCNTCNLSSIGQTSRSLKTHYHGHIRHIKNNNPVSICATHTRQWIRIQNNGQPNDPLKLLHSQYLLTIYEQFYIHSFDKNGELISERKQTNISFHTR